MSNPLMISSGKRLVRRRWRHGLQLFGRGLRLVNTELWCVERPEEVLWLHGEFLKAGADLY